MAQTVVAFFRSLQKADDVTAALGVEGVPREAVRVMTGDLPAAAELIEAGIPPEEVPGFERAMRRGAVLVLAIVDDNIAGRVAQVMDAQGAQSFEDIDATPGPIPTLAAVPEPPRRIDDTDLTSPPPAQAEVAEPEEVTEAAEPAVIPQAVEMSDEGEEAAAPADKTDEIPEPVREEIGRVRVTRSVAEEPVERTVNIREERIEVERRPVQRPASDADSGAFKEEVFEFVETAEKVVTHVRPVVIEEVVLRRTASEREEKVRETLRKGQVSIERLHSDDEQQRFAG